ncbi:MAG TPA: ROK family protein [Candidatus Nanoarchaeia archaeon]|nr:ROK family protein [Candidatus Nanoarchaeia archaeon]
MHSVFVFDIGATKIATAVMDYEGNFLEPVRILQPTPQDPGGAVRYFHETLEHSLNDLNIKAISGGAPALEAGGNGHFMANPSNLPHWGGISLKGKLENIVLSIIRSNGGRYPRIIIESDAYMAAIGATLEKIAEKELEDAIFPLLYVTISTGFGAETSVKSAKGFEIYLNPNGKNREAGHHSFNGRAPNLASISCGHCKEPNCVETWISGKHFKARYGVEPWESDYIVQDLVADNTAKALSEMNFEHEPRLIVLGGGISNNWGTKFLDMVTDHVKYRFKIIGRAIPEVESSVLGSNVNLVGAWALERKLYKGSWPKTDLRNYSI